MISFPALKVACGRAGEPIPLTVSRGSHLVTSRALCAVWGRAGSKRGGSHGAWHEANIRPCRSGSNSSLRLVAALAADPQLASSCEQRKSERTTTHPNQERVTVDV
jgi:hypothetical protein